MKRIIICADGTWNIRDQAVKDAKTRRPTNVTKVARAIATRANGIDQIVVYHEGIGTSGGLDKLTGGAFGDGIEKNIRDLYRSIVYNYEAGDELFFFGFSRGAFTVRTLAGFMNAVGLVHKEDDYWVPEIYGCYEAGKRPGSPEWAQVVAHFEREARGCPPIKFIGVWDTVGALGPPGIIGQVFNPKKYQYHDVTLNSNILNAFQALAIDERRKPFAPSVWDRPANWNGRLEQAWFPGVHTDVGGGSTPDGLANEALHWLIEKAEGLGLALNSQFLAYFKPCFNSVLHDSMTAMYKLLGPNVRVIAAHGPEERPHQAAIDRRHLNDCKYSPENLESYLKGTNAVTPYATTRISRGTPCLQETSITEGSVMATDEDALSVGTKAS